MITTLETMRRKRREEAATARAERLRFQLLVNGERYSILGIPGEPETEIASGTLDDIEAELDALEEASRSIGEGFVDP